MIERVYSFVYMVGKTFPLRPGDWFNVVVTNDDLKIEYHLKKIQRRFGVVLTEAEIKSFWEGNTQNFLTENGDNLLLHLEISDYVDLVKD